MYNNLFTLHSQCSMFNVQCLPPFRGFLSPDNGGTEGGVKTIGQEGGR